MNCAEPLTTGLVKVQKITNKPGKKTKVEHDGQDCKGHGLCCQLKLWPEAYRDCVMMIEARLLKSRFRRALDGTTSQHATSLQQVRHKSFCVTQTFSFLVIEL